MPFSLAERPSVNTAESRRVPSSPIRARRFFIQQPTKTLTEFAGGAHGKCRRPQHITLTAWLSSRAWYRGANQAAHG
jgi:hypothetical protein